MLNEKEKSMIDQAAHLIKKVRQERIKRFQEAWDYQCWPKIELAYFGNSLAFVLKLEGQPFPWALRINIDNPKSKMLWDLEYDLNSIPILQE